MHLLRGFCLGMPGRLRNIFGWDMEVICGFIFHIIRFGLEPPPTTLYSLASLELPSQPFTLSGFSRKTHIKLGSSKRLTLLHAAVVVRAVTLAISSGGSVPATLSSEAPNTSTSVCTQLLLFPYRYRHPGWEALSPLSSHRSSTRC